VKRFAARVSRARCSVLGSALCAARAQAPLLRSVASQNRDPGFFESQVTGTPALQRTAPQELRAALRPGNESCDFSATFNVSSPSIPRRTRATRLKTLPKKIFPIPYPRPPNLPYHRCCPVHEGALLEGTPEWDRARAGRRGNPMADAAPAAVVCTHRLGRPWVSVRAHYGALPLMWLDGDRRAARNRQEPSPRKNGPGS
jgi:hypothetical protein